MMFSYKSLHKDYRDALERSLSVLGKFDEKLILPLLQVSIDSEFVARIFECAVSRLARNSCIDTCLPLVHRLIDWAKTNNSEKRLRSTTYVLGCIYLSRSKYNDALLEFCTVINFNKRDKLHYSAVINTARTMIEDGCVHDAIRVLEASYDRHFWKFGVSTQAIYAARIYARVCLQVGDFLRAEELFAEAMSYAWAINRDDILNDISAELLGFLEIYADPDADALTNDLKSMGVDTEELVELLGRDADALT